MKRADMKAGVVYAYRTGKRGAPVAIVVLDTASMWSDSYGVRVHIDRPTRRPYFRRRDDAGRRPSVGGWQSGMSVNRFGFPAACDRDPSGFRLGEPGDPRRLLRFTLDQFTAATRPTDPDLGVTWAVIDPRFILGEWDEVAQAHDDEAERRRRVEADLAAESAKRVAAARQRVAALSALDLPGKIAEPTERMHRSYRTEWEPPQWSGNTRHVELTLGQVDALLSLIPDGARFVPHDVADDGWTYAQPGGTDAEDGR